MSRKTSLYSRKRRHNPELVLRELRGRRKIEALIFRGLQLSERQFSWNELSASIKSALWR